MLKVENLSIMIKKKTLVDNVSFAIQQKQMFALIGESGSGKSLTALGIMRLLVSSAAYSATSKISLENTSVLDLSERQMRTIRGRKISMIFQDPMTSLNPVLTVGAQLREVLQVHHRYSRQAVLDLLDAVKIPQATQRINCFPHELSGGMKQRVMIAMALACKPSLLIADEPTTALDVTTQAEILALLRELSQQEDMALLFITHDLALAAENSDQIAVMQHGKLIEQCATSAFFSKAHNAYSQKLLNSLPSMLHLDVQQPTSDTILTVQNLKVYFPIKHGLLRRTIGYVKAVDDVSFTVARGETLAIVGESGSGKSTIGKALLRLLPEATGNINAASNKLQVIFQDPYSSLDPKLRIIDTLTEGIAKNPSKAGKIDQLLQQVGLLPEHKWRFPHEFSGGERQRICIARALTVDPEIIICDEPTSSLDVSVQAQVLALLVKLQSEFKLTYVFITHDISLVKLLAHKVAVMYQGKIVEYGMTDAVLQNPQQEYTKKLLAAVPELKILDRDPS